MGTVLVRDFFLGVATVLQDLNPQWRRWGEIELVRDANFGQRALATFLPPSCSRIDAIRLDPGTRQNLRLVVSGRVEPGDGSDMRGIAFLGATRNMGADGITPGTVPSIVDSDTMDTSNPDWHTDTPDVTVIEIVADKTFPLDFYVSPPVHASTPVWLEVKWLAEPKRLVAGPKGAERYVEGGAGANETLSIGDQYEIDLQNYVVAMALLKGSKNVQNLPKAQVHTQLFIQSINAQAQVYSGVSPALTALPFAAQVPAAGG